MGRFILTLFSFLVAALVFAPALTSCGHSRPSAEKEASRAAEEAAAGRTAEIHSAARRGTVIDDYRWHWGGFGTVPIASFTVSNANAFRIWDIQLACTLKASSGTLLDVLNPTLYDPIPAGRRRTFPELNLGIANSQGRRLTCMVFDLKYDGAEAERAVARAGLPQAASERDVSTAPLPRARPSR